MARKTGQPTAFQKREQARKDALKKILETAPPRGVTANVAAGLGKAWDVGNTPLTDAPSRLGNRFADWITTPEKDEGILSATTKGLIGGMGQGIGDLTSSFTSPLGLATTVGTAGLGALASRGVAGAGQALKYGTRGLGALGVGHGGYRAGKGAIEGNLGEVGAGSLEALGGGLGAATTFGRAVPPSSKTPPSTTPPKAKPSPIKPKPVVSLEEMADKYGMKEAAKRANMTVAEARAEIYKARNPSKPKPKPKPKPKEEAAKPAEKPAEEAAKPVKEKKPPKVSGYEKMSDSDLAVNVKMGDKAAIREQARRIVDAQEPPKTVPKKTTKPEPKREGVMGETGSVGPGFKSVPGPGMYNPFEGLGERLGFGKKPAAGVPNQLGDVNLPPEFSPDVRMTQEAGPGGGFSPRFQRMMGNEQGQVLIPPGVVNAVQGTTAKGALNKAWDVANSARTGFMLSGLALPKSLAGNVGAHLATAAEAAHGGIGSMMKGKSPAAEFGLAGRVLKEGARLPTNAKNAYNAWINPSVAPATATGVAGIPASKWGLFHPGRAMGAFDEASQMSLGRAGVSPINAKRALLTENNPVARGIGVEKDAPLLQRAATDLLVPFRKTPFNTLREGVRRTGRYPAIAAGAGGLGYMAGGETEDPKYLGGMAALAGPYAAPFMVGAGLRGARDSTSAIRTLQGLSPIPEWSIPSTLLDPLKPFREPAFFSATGTEPYDWLKNIGMTGPQPRERKTSPMFSPRVGGGQGRTRSPLFGGS